MRQHYKSEHWAPWNNQTPSWYDWKIVESDFKPEQITTTSFLIIPNLTSKSYFGDFIAHFRSWRKEHSSKIPAHGIYRSVKLFLQPIKLHEVSIMMRSSNYLQILHPKIFHFGGNLFTCSLVSYAPARVTIYGPHHEKTCLFHMRTTKAQISLRIRAGWSAPFLFADQIV